MPVVWKNRLLLQHGKTPEKLQGVGPWRWAKLLTGAEWPKWNGNGMEWKMKTTPNFEAILAIF